MNQNPRGYRRGLGLVPVGYQHLSSGPGGPSHKQCRDNYMSNSAATPERARSNSGPTDVVTVFDCESRIVTL